MNGPHKVGEDRDDAAVEFLYDAMLLVGLVERSPFTQGTARNTVERMRDKDDEQPVEQRLGLVPAQYSRLPQSPDEMYVRSGMRDAEQQGRGRSIPRTHRRYGAVRCLDLCY